MTQEPLDAVAEFEKICGLPTGFYFNLLKEDDWSFVIKLHALIEATVSHLLTAACAKPELLSPFARLELSNSATGKLAFAEALNCLDEKDRRFIRRLSEIRNQFVHDVRNAGSDLPTYLSGLDTNQERSFRLAFGPGNDPYEIAGKKIPEAQFVRENPKLAIWLAGTFVIAFAYLRKEEAELNVRRVQLETIRRYLGGLGPGA